MDITVIGIGRLGLGFALLLAKSGYNVMGVDINQSYLDKINDKTFTSNEPQYNELIQETNLKTTTSLKEGINHASIIFILVQTPNGGSTRYYDHSILSSLLTNINQEKPKNKHFIIGCTVMPKYCDEVAWPLLSDCENCTLSYNPEFIAQGDIVRGFENPDIILIGTNAPMDEIEPIMTNIYSKMAKNKPKYCFMKLREAEVTKIGINGYITTKISYANMISDYCDLIGANKNVVLDAVGGDSRIGNKYFRAGYSYGGPCFPRDTKALARCLEEEGLPTELLNATTEYNEFHVEFQAEQLLELAQLQGSDQITIEGICYKEGSKIPIIEESAKLKIAKMLSKNIRVKIKDTPELIQEVRKEYGNMFEYEKEN